MRFQYTLNVVPSIETGEEIVLLRPEIPLRLYGPAGHIDLIALVDTGADNSIFPMSIARELGIETKFGGGPGATAFGGQRIALSFGEVILELSQDGSVVRWRARVHFAELPDDTETAVIVGHEGFLDYFTAIFVGAECILELQPNEDLPAVGNQV
jgi:hypothetical protein